MENSKMYFYNSDNKEIFYVDRDTTGTQYNGKFIATDILESSSHYVEFKLERGLHLKDRSNNRKYILTLSGNFAEPLFDLVDESGDTISATPDVLQGMHYIGKGPEDYIKITEEDYFSKNYLSSLSAMSKLSIMEADDKAGIIGKISPPELNPFLRAAEALNLVKTITIVPAFDENGKSCYMLVRIPYRSYINNIGLTQK
jgi:hypothetical protein